jgi:pimeloyl-ACP methyl ester carboxylesterase
MADALGLLILIGIAAAALVALLTVILVRQARQPPRRTAAWAIARGIPCDPGDLGLEYETWTLDRPGNVRLPVWDVTLNGRGTPGLTAVFLHGWGQSRIEMLSRLDSWGEHCGRAVFYDLRGHGDAEGSSSRLGANEDDDLLDLVGRLGDEPVVLVGHSMGAVIALRAAARAGAERPSIRGVAAYGAYDDFHTSLQGRLRAEGYPSRPMTDLAMRWFDVRGLRQEPARLAAARLPCPVLLVHGRDDTICPPYHAECLAAAANRSTLLMIDGAGHGDAHEVDRAAHGDALRAFVASVRDDALAAAS